MVRAPLHCSSRKEPRVSGSEAMNDEAAQNLRKLSNIIDEWKRNRTGDYPHINAPASSSMVAAASPRMKLSKLRKWVVTEPLTCTQKSVFEGFVYEVSKSSLEKWNQGKKKSSRESRWDAGGELENKTSSAEMEITQFDSLPEDLRVEILSLLPLPKLLQLRLVCKSWDNGLLRSPSMWESWASRQHCWLVMVRREKRLFAKEFIAYCVTNNSRQRKTGHWMSLSPLLESPQVSVHVGGKEALRVACRRGDCHVFSLSLCLVTGGQGHICFMVEHLKQVPPPLEVEESLELHGMVFDQWRSPTPLVVNVLTGATKILPPPQSPHLREVISIHLSMTFLANASNTGYYVVLYDRDCFTYVEVYSSDTGSWRVVLDCGHTPNIHFPVTTDVQSGDLFWFLDGDCAVYFAYNFRSSQCINGIIAYNVQADAWSKVSVDFPSDAYGAYAVITKHKGCLVLVDLVDSPKSRYPRQIMGAVGIWVMQQSSSSPGTASWVQVARTPPQYWEGFYDMRPGPEGTALRGHLFVKFLSFGGLICMTGVTLDSKTNYGRDDYFTPLVYDLDLDSWYHLPAHKGNLDAMGLFAFQPACPMN